MRYIAIIGALLFGIVGLLMSVCGGGFFVMFAWQPSGGTAGFMAVAMAFAIGGGFLAWICFKLIRKLMAER
jgi:hypothetical protein